jgi:4-hydroxy-2-oxoheptanedioate aldolase
VRPSAVGAAVADATRRIVGAGKPLRDGFMKYAWINEVIMAGTQKLLDN